MLEAEIKNLRRSLDREITARKNAWVMMQSHKEALSKATAEVEHAVEAQQRLQLLAQEIQARAHQNIAKIVTKCLGMVFDDPYELIIEFLRTRGKTDARLIYTKDGHEIDPLLTSGGVLDISALALRISSIVLSEPQPRKLLILDEPFTGVSAKNLPRVGALIVSLAQEMGIQFLIVTHSEQLQIGKVIELK